MLSLYLAQKKAEYTLYCADEDGIERVPTKVLRELLEISGSTYTHDMENLCLQGAVAGEILLNLIKLNASDEEASVNKAIRLLDLYFKDAKNFLGSSIASSLSSIRRAWSDYKYVAHFWAALRIHVESAENLAAPIGPDSYLQLLSLATALGKLAPTLSSTHAPKRIYKPDSLWVLPHFVQLPNCSFKCHGLDHHERAWIRKYKAPSVSKTIEGA